MPLSICTENGIVVQAYYHGEKKDLSRLRREADIGINGMNLNVVLLNVVASHNDTRSSAILNQTKYQSTLSRHNDVVTTQ